MKLLIKNGHVMDPASGKSEFTDVWVEDKHILGFGAHPEWEAEAEVINADGCVIAPGLVDVHVHFRDHVPPDNSKYQPLFADYS